MLVQTLKDPPNSKSHCDVGTFFNSWIFKNNEFSHFSYKISYVKYMSAKLFIYFFRNSYDHQLLQRVFLKSLIFSSLKSERKCQVDF